ncbi:MAG: hypothetical protein WB868_16330 [Xanthobacteraceae bacterium]
MLCIKTGMASEYAVAKQYAAADVLVLTGELSANDIDKVVPATCTGIISFGLCGGLAPQAVIGQAFICDTLVTPTGNYQADVVWRKRLYAQTLYYERHWWSSGDFSNARARP